MARTESVETTSAAKTFLWLGIVAATACAGFVWPQSTQATFEFVVRGLIIIAPLVIPGILISAWVTASGAGGHIGSAFHGRSTRTILFASAIGAVTPVCGVTVLPLMAGLLASGVPLAPIMAFWLSSPVTDPAMFATTAATLGWTFAFAKSFAAFGLGMFGGIVTASIKSPNWTNHPLRRTGLASRFAATSSCDKEIFKASIWIEPSRRSKFFREVIALTKLVLICLIPAFAAEYLLNEMLQPDALTAYVGRDSWWAVPFAVFVGAPAYLDGYAALPLTRGLIDHGMSPGAAMAFLVSGSVVSIWGAMAIIPVLRLRPFLLYLSLAVVGSLLSGWLYEAWVSYS